MHTDSPWLPLSSSARGIYLAAVMAPENPRYNTAEVLELPANTDMQLLRRALEQFYAENEGVRVRTRVHAGRAEQQVLSVEEFLSAVQVLEEYSLEGFDSDEAQRSGGEATLPETVLSWARALLAEPLNTDKGVTLRSAYTRYAGKIWLYHSMSHVVADGFAAFNGLSRIAAIYRTLDAGHDVPPAARPGVAQLIAADEAAAAAREADLDFWLSEENAHVLEEPDSSLAGRTAEASPAALRVSLAVPVELQTRLLAAAKEKGASWPHLATAVVGSFLARIANRESAAFGVPQMNRMLPPTAEATTRELAKMSAQTACTAVNVLPVQVPSIGSLEHAIERVKQDFERNAQHPAARQEDLERAARANDARLFGAQINVVPFDAVLPISTPAPLSAEERAAGKRPEPPVSARIHNISAGPVPDMTVTLRGMPGRGNPIALEIDANPALYSPEILRAHASHLADWFRKWAIALEHNLPLEALSTATDAELAVLDSFNAPEHPVEYQSLLQRFIAAVQRHPEQIALRAAAPARRADGSFGLTPEDPQAYDFSQELSYVQLDYRARALAAELIGAGVRPGQAVGLRVERGIEQYVALYALLYAGATYVPVLPELPAERIGVMLEDAGAAALIHGPGLAPLGASELAPEQPELYAQLPQIQLPPINTAQMLSESEVPAREYLPGLDTDLESDAYILFTSGSTGRPKGVAISHRAIDNRLRWQQHQIPIAAGDKVLHKTAISFDVHVWELYWPLQEGASVVIAAPEGHRDPAYLARVIAEQGVDCLHFVPTMLTAFLSSPSAARILREVGYGEGENDKHLKYLVCSGEALHREQILEAHRALGVWILNLYGPTEAAVDVTFWDSSEDPEREQVPIGEPVWNTGTFILDKAGRPVPAGVLGELYLSGVQLARGYKNNPEATAAAFGEDAANGMRVYRTGDLATWELLPDESAPYGVRGVILYRGRADSQVKLNGQRLELGDIEATLTDSEHVSGAVAMLYTGPEGHRAPALAAFLETGTESEEEQAQIIESARAHAQASLPEYMVPTLWHAVHTFPVGTSGKADRKLLARHDFAVSTGEDGPQDLLQQQLAAIFASALGVERVGVHDDFFAFGGSSMSALNVIASIEEQLGITVSIGALFAYPSVAELAESLGENSGAEFLPVLPLRRVPESPEPDAPAPLFILPPAGGLGWSYAPYAAALPSNQAIYTLQLAPFSDESASMPASLDELARYFLSLILGVLEEKQLPARVQLMGWSVGGTASVQTAALLREAGVEIERVVVLDGYPAEQWADVPAPDEQESYRALLRMAGLPEPDPEEVLDLPTVLERLKAIGSALGYLGEDALGVTFAAMQASPALLRGASHRYYDGPVIMVAAVHEDQPYLDASGWSAHCSDLEVVNISEASHTGMVNDSFVPQIVSSIWG